MLYQYVRWVALVFVLFFLAGALGFSLVVN